MAWGKEAAQDLALAGLGYVASHEDLAGPFMAASGADAGDLRRIASQPEFLVFVLDFLLESDDRVLEFAAAQGIGPEQVQQARLALAGPGEHGWDPD